MVPWFPEAQEYFVPVLVESGRVDSRRSNAFHVCFAHYSLFTTHYSLFTTHCLLLTTHLLRPVQFGTTSDRCTIDMTMQINLIPPTETTQVSAHKVLVLAPHFDDEVFGCGGLLAQLAESGAEIRVLYLTDSSGGEEITENRDDYAARRRAANAGQS